MDFAHAWWNALLDVLFGSTCAGCRRRGAGAACAVCRAAAQEQSRISGTVFVDDAPVTQLVRAAKYGRWRAGGRWFADRLVDRLDPGLCERVVAVAWVPRSRARARRRGADLPRAVARRAAHRLGIPTVDVLVRSPRSRRQRGLDRQQRRANARASFDLHAHVNHRIDRAMGPPSRGPGAVVLLVDDVCTTGATLSACAALLTVALRRRFRDIHVHPIALATVPARGSAPRGVDGSAQFARKMHSGESLTVPIANDRERSRKERSPIATPARPP